MKAGERGDGKGDGPMEPYVYEDGDLDKLTVSAAEGGWKREGAGNG